MKAAVVYLRPRAVVFMREKGNYGLSVGRAWSRMFDWLEGRRLRNDVSIGYGLAHDDPRLVEAGQCRYDACVELGMDALATVGGEVRSQNLPGGAYARSRVAGGYQKIADVVSSMRDNWMPSQGLKIDPRRPMIAIYLSDPRFVADVERRADICLPVDPK